MTSRTMTTTVTVPSGGSPYHPIEQRTTTTTVTASLVRGRRLRLFLSGLIQLSFGGLSLIPVLLLGPNPLTIACCACLAFTGMLGFLGACFTDTKPSSSVAFDPHTRTQLVVTHQPFFPRFYCFMVIVGFFLGVASAIQGIIMISDDDDDDYRHWTYVRGAIAVGIGIFLALNQMLMICCVAPLARASTTSSEQVIVQPIGAVVVPTGGAYHGVDGAPYLSAGHVPAGGIANNPVYPYIDEPIKEDPPSYSEATRSNYQHTAQPSAPPEKV